MLLRSLLPLLCLVVFLGQHAQAQIQVGLDIKRRLFVAYEPVVATITIRNLSGRDLPLADVPNNPWFSFQIVRADGQPVAPRHDQYELEPLIIPAGQTVKRSVNLNSLYPLGDYGLYRIRAAIYFSPMDQYFQSPLRNIEVTDGKVFWQQTVGVPEGQPGAGENRTVSILKFRKTDAEFLYVRIRNPDDNTVYCTFSVDRLIGGIEPEIQLDLSNQLHILQVVGPKTYKYTQVGLNGELMTQETLLAVKNRPRLRRDEAGYVAVRGGRPQSDQVAQTEIGSTSAAARGVPKLSDRPANLPKE